MVRWTEAQLARVRQPPTKREPRTPAASPWVLADNEMEIPWLVPLPNTWGRMHFKAKKRQMLAIAQVLALRHPKFVGLNLQRAKVTVIRCSAVEPDPDAVNFVKPVLDAIQPTSKRHPYGIGVIAEDSGRCIELVTLWQRAPRNCGRTIVRIEPRE